MKRDGFVPGEGAAILVMESLEHAIDRGASILAEVVGYGVSSDAFHAVQPDEDGSGAARAISWALEDADLKPSEISYINAHGTSTPKNDHVETLAIKQVFGDDAYKIPISSTKSMIGHVLGGAGAIEAVACVKSIEQGIIHPTVNYEYPDPECDLDYVPNEARQADVTSPSCPIALDLGDRMPASFSAGSMTETCGERIARTSGKERMAIPRDGLLCLTKKRG